MSYHFDFGAVGCGDGDTRIAAYDSSVAIGAGETQAWKCPACTFHNAEMLGRFCSMCGSPREWEEKNTAAPVRGSSLRGDIFVESHERNSNNEIETLPPRKRIITRRSEPNRKSLEEMYNERNSNNEIETPPPRKRVITRRSEPNCQSLQEMYNETLERRSSGILPAPANPDPRNSQRVEPRRLRDVVEDTSYYPYGTKKSPPSQEKIDDFSLTLSPERGAKHNVKLPPTEVKEGEGSFTIGTLLDDPPPLFDTDSKLPQTQEANPTNLGEKDFQMSFANWSISDQGAWTCIACTYVNTNALHLTCEVCGQNRPGKTAAIQSQNVVQTPSKNSIGIGQNDFLKIQQEKIEEMEERVIAVERMHEIEELQEDLMEDIEDAANSSTPADKEEDMKLARQWIAELEEVRAQEVEEQERMAHYLEGKRQNLGLERMDTQRALLPTTTRPLSGLESTAEAVEVRGQERMFLQRKQQFDERNDDVQRIRKRQQALYEKLQSIN